MDIKLVARTGRSQGQAVEVRAEKFFIGSSTSCQLRPEIPGLAGVHALVEQRHGQVYVRDYGGEGGTKVNDRVLHQREVEVFDADQIEIGPLVLTLSITPHGAGPPSLAQVPAGWPFTEPVAAPTAKPQPSPAF